MGTFISVPRSLFNDGEFPEEPFSRREAFLDLVQRASYKPSTVPTKGGMVDIGRGEQIVSVRMLALRWGWGKSKVSKVLDEFEMQSRIGRRTDDSITIVSINNYDVFQHCADTDKDTNEDGKGDNINNVNNDNKKPSTEVKAKPRPRFVKPTVDDVKAYCKASGYQVDAENFVNFYESKGWVVGKSPMKDWKAAVRTWVRKDREEGVNRPAVQDRPAPAPDIPLEEAIKKAKNPTAEEKAKFWNEMVKPHYPKRDGETDEQYRERLKPIYHCQYEAWVADRVFRTQQKYL